MSKMNILWNKEKPYSWAAEYAPCQPTDEQIVSALHLLGYEIQNISAATAWDTNEGHKITL